MDIHCKYEFKYSDHKWDGVPIMSSNMDTVTNVHTSMILADRDWISVFPKHFNLEWKEATKLPSILGSTNKYVLSCGTSKSDVMAIKNASENI